MQITEKKLKELNAGQSGIDWFNTQKTDDPKKLFDIAIKAEKFSDINWVITKLMSKKQRVMYAIFAAEQVIGIFEKSYPNDKRPRDIIAAAKADLKNPRKRTKNTAARAVYVADVAVTYAAVAADLAGSKKEMYVKILTFGFKLLTEAK